IGCLLRREGRGQSPRVATCMSIESGTLGGWLTRGRGIAASLRCTPRAPNPPAMVRGEHSSPAPHASMHGSLWRNAGIQGLPPLRSCSPGVFTVGLFSILTNRFRNSGRASATKPRTGVILAEMRSRRRALLWASAAVGLLFGCSVNHTGLTDDGGLHADAATGTAGSGATARRGGTTGAAGNVGPTGSAGTTATGTAGSAGGAGTGSGNTSGGGTGGSSAGLAGTTGTAGSSG